MCIIYKSFFKKKSTKIYLGIFLLLGIIFSFVFISEKYLLKKGNEAYPNSFISFNSKENINLSKENGIKAYNKAIELECNNILMSVYVTETTPIIKEDNKENLECYIDNYTVNYSYLNSVTIVENKELFNHMLKDEKEYSYFITLNSWIEKDKIIKKLSNKYHVELITEEQKIDNMDYKNIIIICNIFINVIEVLFLILLIISFANIIIDESKNNKLYYCLGYSEIKIALITINKIIFIILIPLCIFSISLIIAYFI